MRLKKGDKLTDLSLPSVKGNVFNIENIAGKKALISPFTGLLNVLSVI